MKQRVVQCVNIQQELKEILNQNQYDKLFVLTDEHTNCLCLPLLIDISEIQKAEKILIPAGDENKNLETLSGVWNFLSEHSATRKSLLINLGGGMLTDLGGFAAATFKRGIRFINIPTTLLGAVDAAVGGKTGINFNGLKNEIGAFQSAEAVLIESAFFKTLDHTNFLSGYAEMLKHGLLSSEEELSKLLAFDTDAIDYELLKDLLFQSVLVKEKIIEEDPTELGIRKALNLGHTIGHAFESFSYEVNRPIPHGYAVAWGMVCELYLSFRNTGFSQKKLNQTVLFIKENYGSFDFNCKQYDRLFTLMQHDKKNDSINDINFTLLGNIGDVKINQVATKEEIFEALDFYRDCF